MIEKVNGISDVPKLRDVMLAKYPLLFRTDAQNGATRLLVQRLRFQRDPHGVQHIEGVRQ